MLTAKIVALAVLGALLGYLTVAFVAASFDVRTWSEYLRASGALIIWVCAIAASALGTIEK